MILDEKNYLKHFGVKGMRWGHRKAKRKAQYEENVKRLNSLIDAATKDDRSLILLNGQLVTTGKEFVDHMIAGGMIDVSTTRVYARQETKNGPYVLQ